MVQFCCILGCGNRSNRDPKKFYRLPTIPKLCKSISKAELILKRRRQWLDNIDRVDLKDGDSSYSPGYIRVCSDHFHYGKPCSLMDVDHPDWAPTVKMGSGPIKMKGSKLKRQMLGFSSPNHAKRRKSAKQTYTRRIPIITDDQEISRRRKLAHYVQTAEKTKHYISYKSVRQSVAHRPQLLVPTMAKKTFMKRETLMHVKLLQNKEVQKKDDDNQSYKSPTIHRITVKDTIITNDHTIHSFTKSSANCKIPDVRMFDESSNSEFGGTFLEKCGVKLFDDSTNSVSNESFVYECSAQVDKELEMINEFMNGHLTVVKTEFEEKAVDNLIFEC